jgi:hypothetical protein
MPASARVVRLFLILEDTGSHLAPTRHFVASFLGFVDVCGILGSALFHLGNYSFRMSSIGHGQDPGVTELADVISQRLCQRRVLDEKKRLRSVFIRQSLELGTWGEPSDHCSIWGVVIWTKHPRILV